LQGELERLLADYDRSMIKDGPAGSFLPLYMKDDDGKLLPEYNDVATLYLKVTPCPKPGEWHLVDE
jgi:hypothetical protein